MAEKKEDFIISEEDLVLFKEMQYTEGMIIALEHLASRGLSVFRISWSENDTFKRVKDEMVVENMTFEVKCLDGKGYTDYFYITVNILTGEEVKFK